MKPTNREIEMVYSQEEMERKVDQLKMQGYSENDIHVLARDKGVLNSADSQTDINTHEAESFSSRFKSFFSGEETIRTELEKLDMDKSALDAYQKDIENGSILLYTDRKIANRENENFSSFGDDTRPIDADEEKRNTAFTPFGKDIERDGRRHNDEKIVDEDVKPEFGSSDNNSDEIYTTEVPREEQHGEPGYADKSKDSRLDGENIHPTTDSEPKDEGEPREKELDHEPPLGTEEGEENLNREDGVNRRQDEQSPGVDPNLGPAPFGRDSEEEHLLRGENEGENRKDPNQSLMQDDGADNRQNPRDSRPFHEDVEKKTATPPTPRLF